MYPASTEVFFYNIQPYDSYWRLAQKFRTTVEAISSVNPGIPPGHLYVGQRIAIPHSPHRASNKSPHCISEAEVALKSTTRLLWEQHITWTRMAIISLTFKLPDVDFVIARLLQNATDMGNSIKPCYGEEIGNKYGALIKDHLLIAADLVKVAMKGDQQAVAATQKKWYANAEDIARFLSSINPYLTEEGVRKMFFTHLDLTAKEAVSMINKDYKTDVAVFDEIEKEALEMADAISSAIVKQFPDLFKEGASSQYWQLY
ncbi:MAG TPA: LysM domain-containing protein [Bacillales bacterium]|nr:LysM domain-containing protein [Bacillales bacterium]